MEFWGVEVKAGQPLKVKPTFDNIIHLSQASLGESKKEKGCESVPLFVNFGDQKLILGTLVTDNIPQLSFDLVFEKEFELFHNWKNGSVYFCGYQTPLPQDSSDEFDMEDSEENEEIELPSIHAENGKAGPKTEKSKGTTATKTDAAKPAKPSKYVKSKQDDGSVSDDESDSDDEMLDGDDSDEISSEEGSDEDEEDSEDEETPKALVVKKRPTESATRTPVPAKKAKTPMTGGKKGAHVATPHPSTQGGKTSNDKMQIPKSGGQHTCNSCSKSFGSENALQSHSKAKHAGK